MTGTGTGYIYKAKETKVGMKMRSTNIKIQKAWPKIHVLASENNDQLLLVSIKNQQ